MNSTNNILRASRGRSSNDENVAPTLQKPARRGQLTELQAAARRRRARATGTQNTANGSRPRRRQMRTRPTFPTLTFNVPPPQVDDVDMLDATQFSQSQPSTTSNTYPLSLPMFLERPEYKGVNREHIALIDPELKDTEPIYIREKIATVCGTSMLHTVSGVQAAPFTGILPKQMPITVTETYSEPPTHMFAVYATSSPNAAPVQRHKVTLYPAHDLVLASYCANLPILPGIKGTNTRFVPDGTTLTVPVIPFCIPSPTTFSPLIRFMYNRDLGSIHRMVFPCPLPRSHLSIFDAARPGTLNLRVEYARQIANTSTGEVLMRHLALVQGLYRNVCVLGVEDQTVWATIDAAWHVMLLALAIASGNTESMIALVGGSERAQELSLI